ncbi:MAG: hypothetical protein LQ338_004173 [Usnochroma carphineum]|nr:MAG: hypothetical protein LQ338_004173 [Usnochroma carphineum]
MSLTSTSAAATDLDVFGHTPSPAPTPINAESTFAIDPSPTAAQYTGHPSTDRGSPSDDETSQNGILNYYFLLLALLIIVVGIIYLFFMKRQRQKLADRRRNGQRALARDLERWGGGGPWSPPRFRMPRSSPRQPRREEGLDESGEAPPPYVPKEPEPAYTAGAQRDGLGSGHDIPLQDMERSDQKPPDYDEGPSSSAGHGTSGPGPMTRHE